MKSIVITGASKGIGRATAKRFASEGYTCVLNARSEEELRDLARSMNGDHAVVPGDISEPSTSERLRDAVDDQGGLNTLFCNAGYGVFDSVEDMSLEDFQGQFDVNVTGVFLTIKHLLPVFREQNTGSIIALSSMAAKNTFPGGSAYAATKHALTGLMGSVKAELRDTQVKCGTILPGSVDTSFFDGLDAEPTPDRHLDPEDVAETVWWVANQPGTADLDEVVLRPAKRDHEA